MGFGGYSYNSFIPRKRGSAAYLRTTDGSEGKRVKRVFSTDQVIHVWAQRTQTNGQNGKGNVYFEGDRLFDYGDHFCLGQFVTNAEGEVACLLNSDSYGPTTSQHQSATARAVPDSIPTFTIPGAGYGRQYGYKNELAYDLIIETYAKRATELAAKGKRARKEYSKDWNNTQAAHIIKEARAFCAFFGFPDFTCDLDELVKASEAAAARVAEEKRVREAEQRARVAEDFAKWQRGESDHCPYAHMLDEKGGYYIRVKGDQLQTSGGAEVPLAHAVRVFRFVKRCKERGEAWKRNGHQLRVGLFKVDSVNPDGSFVAGCHKFTWATIEAAAKLIGVADLAAADTTERTEAHA